MLATGYVIKNINYFSNQFPQMYEESLIKIHVFFWGILALLPSLH